MKRFMALLVVGLLGLAVACDVTELPSCGVSTATFSSTAPNFVAKVSRVLVESGSTPEGNHSQVDVWLMVLPASSLNAGMILTASTPVFERATSGTITPTTACPRFGDTVEVWHDFRWSLGAVEAPPGDTLYFPTQIVIHRVGR